MGDVAGGGPGGRRVRVMGGRAAVPGQFPWLVSLQRQQRPQRHRWQHFCAGSLLTTRHVVTAAHCLHNSGQADWRVVAGEHNISSSQQNREQVRKVSQTTPRRILSIFDF